MSNGIWNRETYMIGVPEEDEKRASMTFDMLKSIDNRLDTITKLPEKCEEKWTASINAERKRRGRINLGVGGGGGLSAVALWEAIKALWN